MPDDNVRDRGTTRREYLKYGGAVAGGGFLAGCSSGGGGSTTGAESTTADATGTDAAETTADATGTDAESTAETAAGDSYTVSMSPVGEVEFPAVPENVMVYSQLYADMAVAYGAGDAVNSIGFSADAAGALTAYYAKLDGVEFDREGLAQLNSGGSGNIQVSKELLYELDSDLHLMDPALMLSFDGWEMADIEEVRENVAPWFGNVYSRRNTEPPEPYRDDYEYYTLWEIADKVSQVFQQRSRYEELASIHDGMLSEIESNLPAEEERPAVGSVLYMSETFYPSKINTEGFATAHVRPLGANDAFVGEDVTYETSYDFETLLEIDPDVILHRYGVGDYYDVSAIREEIADHPVGGQLSAIENDRFYASADPVQGPLMNLFQLEMTAKQLYPEQFGEWPEYDGGAYPEIPEGERLFDRSRVASIVNGEA
ncbi:ABC transporter substrate-binding protein [Candidatus Halobonum tyrrellensis]|uniref:Ferrichrome-binding protein n=1 Tax=Candidatus Halobonum tyrrellensis G22 TaxID=1324957 RepID=V4HGX9_9EURY|nr:ABC transporter substrate-binding protein [Candidatus Halobonum tyrrellensis]ESP89970.1 ferrichrome-binding protein [Candidatus Halobonum tyrrellensis G22]